jgi:hypothetical protein
MPSLSFPIGGVCRALASLGLLGLTATCNSTQNAPGNAGTVKPSQPVQSAAAALPPPAADPGGTDPEAPRLVVAIIIDQLGSDTLLSSLGALDPAGALARAVDSGVYFERSAYAYANTLTAPGHVAVHTGAPPQASGIEGNSTWDYSRGPVPVTNDPSRPVFGREPGNAGASPTRLRVPTVAHALRAATQGAAKVISLSIKDRSAILSVGTAADLVLWYDAKLGDFTSSAVWGPALPAWLTRYRTQHPIGDLLVPWVAEKPDAYLARLGPDAARGEGDLGGFGIVFPHRFDGVENPLRVLQLTPMLSEYLVSLTETAARELHLGEDDVPDLIALSISGTDGAGHVFGPHSWEYIDHLVRADRAVGAWLSRLEQRTRVAVLITSDHGVSPLPETLDGSGRLYPARIARRIDAALSTHFGAGPWLADVLTPFVYLNARARQHPERARLVEVARAALLEEPSVRDAWTLERVRAFGDADPIEKALRLSVAPDNEAALMFLTRPYHPLDLRDPPDRGTNHGTPYDYDRQVPVLAWGASIPHRRSAEPIDQMRVAATLAHLLRVSEPSAAAKGSLF